MDHQGILKKRRDLFNLLVELNSLQIKLSNNLRLRLKFCLSKHKSVSYFSLSFSHIISIFIHRSRSYI